MTVIGKNGQPKPLHRLNLALGRQNENQLRQDFLLTD